MMIDLKNIPTELVSFDAVEGVPMVDLPQIVPDAPLEQPEASPSNEATLQVNQEVVTLMGETLGEVFKDAQPLDVYVAMKYWTNVFEDQYDIKGVEFN